MPNHARPSSTPRSALETHVIPSKRTRESAGSTRTPSIRAFPERGAQVRKHGAGKAQPYPPRIRFRETRSRDSSCLATVHYRYYAPRMRLAACIALCRRSFPPPRPFFPRSRGCERTNSRTRLFREAHTRRLSPEDNGGARGALVVFPLFAAKARARLLRRRGRGWRIMDAVTRPQD